MAFTDSELGDELLDEIARALGTTDDFGYTTWLDTVEQRTLLLTFDPWDDEPSVLSADAPDWQHQERALGQRIREDSDRYRRIAGTGTPGRLHEFIHSVRDDSLQERLWSAIRGGRGAYRRVRGVLRQQNLEHLWHDFEAAANRQLALEWLRSEALLPEDP